MPLVFRTLHAAPRPELLNEEWIVVENTGPGVLTAAGWTISVAPSGKRPRSLGTLSPGFTMQPGDKVRIITGTASKKSQGTPPADDGLKAYHLFLKEPVLARPGITVFVHLKQLEVARAVFDPQGPDGIRVAAG
jgi:hypothetical protein